MPPKMLIFAKSTTLKTTIVPMKIDPAKALHGQATLSVRTVFWGHSNHFSSNFCHQQTVFLLWNLPNWLEVGHQFEFVAVCFVSAHSKPHYHEDRASDQQRGPIEEALTFVWIAHWLTLV